MIDQTAGQLIALLLFAAMVYGWRNPSERFLFWIGFIFSLLIVAWRTSCWSHFMACST